MSREEIRDAMLPAKKENKVRGKTTYLDGVDISRGKTSPEFFAFGPKGQTVEDRNKAFAYYSETAEGSRACFVKTAIAGPSQGHLLNVLSPTFKKGDESHYEKDLGRMRYEFKPVNQRVFDLYLKFLKTRNENFILQAERENVNA